MDTGTPCPDLKLTHGQVHDELRSLNESESPWPKSPASESSEGDGGYDYSPIADHLNMASTSTQLDTGEVPEAWRWARVTAIYKKKGSRNDPGNYIPVSLTSICCKVLKKAFCETHEPHQPIHKKATRILGLAILYHTELCCQRWRSGPMRWTRGWLSTRFTSILPKCSILCRTDDWWQSSNPTRFLDS